MQLDTSIPYDPTLRLLLNRWLTQDSKYYPRALQFLLFVAVLHKDEKLATYCLDRGADINYKPEPWYARFLGNFKSGIAQD